VIITAVLLVNSAIALTCSADNLNKPGTCIKDTFKLFGRSIYKACYFDPYYSDGSLWSGYTLCYATIRKGNLVSDAGSLVADAYTTNQHQLVECHYYNGAKCDVFTTNGFTSSATAIMLKSRSGPEGDGLSAQETISAKADAAPPLPAMKKALTLTQATA